VEGEIHIIFLRMMRVNECDMMIVNLVQTLSLPKEEGGKRDHLSLKKSGERFGRKGNWGICGGESLILRDLWEGSSKLRVGKVLLLLLL